MRELDDELIGKALSTPLFILERGEPANLRQLITLMKKVCCQLSPFSHAQVRADTYTNQVQIRPQELKSSRDLENERIRILLGRQKEQILAEVRSEIQKHELQTESDKISIQELTGIIDSQRMEIDHTIAWCEQPRRDQRLLQEELSQQNRDLRETRIKSLHEMEELKRVQGLQIDESSRRRLIENQDTINEFTARVQELQNQVNCMIDSREFFKDAESVRSGHSRVPSQPALLPLYRDSGGMLSRLGRMLSRNDKLPDIWDTHGISGYVFANPRAYSSSPCPGEFNPWISNVTEDTPVLTSTKRPLTCGESQLPDTILTPRLQTGPSARNSFDPKEGRFSNNYGGRPTKTADLGTSLRRIPQPSNVRLLEDEIQD